MTATDLSLPAPAVAAPGNRSAPADRPVPGWRLVGYAALVRRGGRRCCCRSTGWWSRR